MRKLLSMNKKSNQIDLVKLLFYILKRLWLVVLCAEIGFGVCYTYLTQELPDTFTAYGTMYVSSNSPDMYDAQSTYSGDLTSASQLIKTLLVVVKRDTVMAKVTDSISADHPEVTAAFVSESLSMESVSDTGVVAVKSTTEEAQLSADIVNAVMEIAPKEIIHVVGLGNVEIMDYAAVPVLPNDRNAVLKAFQYGALAGAVLAIVLLSLLYVLNQRITDVQEIKDSYDSPILASIRRVEVSGKRDAGAFLLTENSSLEIQESYAKLRMNLFYTLAGKDNKTVVVTSAVSGEGKSTIASNLAISCAMSGNRVLLVDGDLRRSSQLDIFKFDPNAPGLSDVLVGKSQWQNTILKEIRKNVDLLPTGYIPPNPSELLESDKMKQLMKEWDQAYDLVLLDMPPIDIVADPLVLSAYVSGCVFVVRQNFSNHPDIRRALVAAEMTGMNILGFVYYCDHMKEGSRYSRRYYKNYYKKYDNVVRKQ